MASLLLADRVVTLAPAPQSGGVAGAKMAAKGTTNYRQFMETWRWCAPLFESGLIVPGLGPDGPAEDMREIARRISEDDSFSSLRPLMKEGLFEDDSSYLGALSSDLLKGGPDPAVTVPMMAGLDRFAARNGYLVARSEPVSHAQRAESRFASEIFSTAVPILEQATAERIIETRELLTTPLRELRETLNHACKDGSATASSKLASAAATYAHAFEGASERITLAGKDDDCRVVIGYAAISAVSMPQDAVLRSSLSVVEQMTPGRSDRFGARARTSVLPARIADGNHGRFVGLIVRMIGTRSGNRQ